jgi:ankyrin repeat protein
MEGNKEAYEIFDAIEANDYDKVKTFLSNNRNLLNMITPFGTWLHVACMEGKYEIVGLLVQLGLDINIKSGTFNAGAINRAASEGYYDIVQYLLSCGAEMDISEPDRNPLFAAIYGGHKDIVKLLLDSGIDASVKYTGEYMKNMDAYDFAIERGQKEIAEMLKPYRK